MNRSAEPASPWRTLSATLVAVAFGLPALVMVVGSLRRPGLPPERGFGWYPSDPSTASFGRAFELVDLARQLGNSVVVAIVATPLAVVSASLAAFAITRTTPLLARLLLALVAVTIVLPPVALLVGRFAVYRQLGLIDTFVPLVAPATFGVSGFTVLLYTWAFRRLPPQLFDAADLDDVPLLSSWWRIALPLTRPVTVAVATLAFAATWSDFLSPLAFVLSESRYTLPLGLRSLQLVGRQDLPVLLAGCAAATAPVVVVFAVTQRWLFASVRGLGR